MALRGKTQSVGMWQRMSKKLRLLIVCVLKVLCNVLVDLAQSVVGASAMQTEVHVRLQAMRVRRLPVAHEDVVHLHAILSSFLTSFDALPAV